MAKRLENEQPYRPVLKQVRRDLGPDRALVESVMAGVGQGAAPQAAAPEAAAAGAAPALERPVTTPSQADVVDLPRRESAPERPDRSAAKGPKMAYEAPTIHERFKVTHEEKMENRSLLTRHSEALGTVVAFAHVMRAWVTILKKSEPEVIRALQRAQLRRPSNEDPLALADFEHKLAHIYLEALRNAPPIEKEG